MRYILDIADTTGAPANYAKEFMEEICETMADHIVTIVCIDETNANQFHDDPTKNTLTDAQLQRYTDYCHSDRPNQQTNKPNRTMTREQSLVWASAHFLSTPLPSDIFEYGDSDDILQHIADHPWQPFENHSASDVWSYIEALADDVRKLITNQTK